MCVCVCVCVCVSQAVLFWIANIRTLGRTKAIKGKTLPNLSPTWNSADGSPHSDEDQDEEENEEVEPPARISRGSSIKKEAKPPTENKKKKVNA